VADAHELQVFKADKKYPYTNVPGTAAVGAYPKTQTRDVGKDSAVVIAVNGVSVIALLRAAVQEKYPDVIPVIVESLAPVEVIPIQDIQPP